MRINREGKRDAVRFGYRKIALVPWKVMPRKEEVGGKEASEARRLLQKSSQERMKTRLKQVLPKWREKRHPCVIFLQASLKTVSGMQNSYKLTLG